MSKRIGPSMSTEPGWKAVCLRLLHYFGSSSGHDHQLPQHAVEF